VTVTVRQLIEEQAAGLVGREEAGHPSPLLGEGGRWSSSSTASPGVGNRRLSGVRGRGARRGATVLASLPDDQPTERGFPAALASATGAELITRLRRPPDSERVL
jgi:hypothetical protein